jgi:hypothetical protein
MNSVSYLPWTREQLILRLLTPLVKPYCSTDKPFDKTYRSDSKDSMYGMCQDGPLRKQGTTQS